MLSDAIEPASVHAHHAVLAPTPPEGERRGGPAAEVRSYRDGLVDPFESHGWILASASILHICAVCKGV